MNLVDIYFKKGQSVKGYVIEVSHLNLGFNKVYLAESRYQLHILRKHPEANISIVEKILQSPDIITRGIRQRNHYSFYKDIGCQRFKACVLQGYINTLPKNKAYLLSAYALINPESVDYQRQIFPYEEIDYDFSQDPAMYDFNFG